MEHREAVQKLLKMDNYEKVYKMISILEEKAFQVMETSKTILKDAGLLDEFTFPEKAELKDGRYYLSNKQFFFFAF